MIVQLDKGLWFPDPRLGEPDGLFAIGGDLSTDRLLLAYSHGIFPWFSFRDADEPHWYCPMKRFVIFPEEIHISHSMRTLLNKDRYQEMIEMLEREKPDVVITHWPIDGHRDHAVRGILVLDAWRRLDRCFELYYFEVMSGTQTQLFHPTDWVDITTTQERKYKACYCHESQGLKETMDNWHTPMERFRGIECRCTAAEAFLHHAEPVSLV